MSYLMLFIYLALLILIINRSKFFKSKCLSGFWVSLIFISKFIAGIILWAMYSYMFSERASGDIFKYFDDGNIIFYALRENPLDYLRMVTGIGADAPHLMQYYDTCWYWIKEFNYGLINDNRIVIRFNAFVRLFSLGNIHIHTLFMSFASFTGLWGIYKVFESKTKTFTFFKVVAIFFLPSVFFWTSGLLKEGLLSLGFGLLFYHIDRFLNNKATLKSALVIAACIFLLLLSKFYVLVAAIPGFLFLLLHKYLNIKSIGIKLLLTHGIFIILAWFSDPLVGINFPNIIANKQHDFINQTNSMNEVGSAINIGKLDSTFTTLIINTPKALFNSLLRPTVFEVKNTPMLMAAAENTLIVILIILSIAFFRKKYLNEPLFWFSISFCTILFCLIGLTTPVLGALVRYKAPALPFLGMIFIYLIDNDKINLILKRLRSKMLN